MADKFIQYLGKNLDRNTPNYEEMSREELISYIKENINYKHQIKTLVKIIFLTFQEIFSEEYNQGEEKVEFEGLEGKYHYDLDTGNFLFTPNGPMQRLINGIEVKGDSVIKTVYKTRFYKMVESLYHIEKDHNKI